MLDILYCDDNIVAINKPNGLLVHRSGLAPDRETCHSILSDQLGEWVHTLHRLDRGTSGVLLFAFHSETSKALNNAFRDGEIKKRYVAIVRGYIAESGEIDYPIRPENGEEGEAKEAQTSFRSLGQVELPFPSATFPTSRYSLAELTPHTGRRHQLRRHMKHLSHPVIGDTRHGDTRHNIFFREHFGFYRLALHATSVEFIHPVTNQPTRIYAPFPDELSTLIVQLGWGAISAMD